MAEQLTWKQKAEVLRKAGPDFHRTIAVDPVFMSHLVQRRVLFDYQSQDIQALQEPSKQKDQLLDHLRRAKVEQFIDFCLILHDVWKRADIVKDIFGLDINHLRLQKEASGKPPEIRAEKEPSAAQEQGEVASTSKQLLSSLQEDEAVPEQVPSTSSSKDPGVPAPIWTEANTAEQGIVEKSRYHRQLLNLNWEDLRDNVRMQGLWGHLRPLNVLDVPTELKARTIETNSVQVQLLLEVLMKSPRWRLNAFIRALCLSGQDHVVTNILHLNTQDFCPRQDYQDGDQTHKSMKRPRQSSHSQEVEENDETPKKHLKTAICTDAQRHRFQNKEEKKGHQQSNEGRREVTPSQAISTEGCPVSMSETSQVSNYHSLSEGLLQAILFNCKQCLKELMIRTLYDLDNHPEADIIELSKCYVQLEAQFQMTRRNRVELEVTLEDILKRWDGGTDRYTIRLQGDPGCGKTTWMTRLAYIWSKDFLEKRRGNWNLMVYIPARAISGSIEETIRKHLWCPKEYLDCMMEYVNKGHRVCLLFDGFDEIRNDIIAESLKAYIQEVHRRGGPTIFVSTRRALCSIARKEFNILLDLRGFSEEQGIDYVERYFKMEPSGQSRVDIVKYVRTHRARMQSVLCNPLQLSIFCALASENLLILEDNTIFRMTTLYEPLEKFLIRREDEKNRRTSTITESEDFHRMCLHGLLNDIREFSKDNLDSFNISPTYQEALLVKHIDTHLDAEDVVSYAFPHETMFEYFGSSYIKRLTQQDLMTLLLPICRQRSLQNVQKIIIELIQIHQDNSEQLIQAMIRAILIFQHPMEKTGNEVVDNLLELPNTIESTVNIKDVLLTHQDEDLHVHTDSIWHKIHEAFDVHAEVLRSVDWFGELEKDGTIDHVVDCLKVCSPSEQENIMRKTVHLLLPSKRCDSDGNVTYTVAAGSMRWAEVEEMEPGGEPWTWISPWCPQDVIPAIHNYKQAHLQQDAALHDVSIVLNMFLPWGPCPDSMWTMEEWTPVMEELFKPQHQVKGISVHPPLDTSVPLDGLLCAARHTIKQGHSLTRGMNVVWGKVSEVELKDTMDWAVHVGLELDLVGITVVLSAAHTIQDVPAVHTDLINRCHTPGVRELHISEYVTSDGQHERVYPEASHTGNQTSGSDGTDDDDEDEDDDDDESVTGNQTSGSDGTDGDDEHEHEDDDDDEDKDDDEDDQSVTGNQAPGGDGI